MASTPVSAQQVEQAIHALYYEQDPLRSQANHWLLQLQAQPTSWEIAPALLNSQVMWC